MQVTSRISDDSSQAKTALSPVALRRNMRLEQCGKLVELRQALLEAGLLTLNSQAGALGLGRSMGLPQVYGFAKQSGGAVYVDSAVNRGTTIMMLLPRSQQPALAPLAVAALDVNKESRGSAGAALLVEDDDEVASTVAEMLMQLGYDVTRAASAEEALGRLNDGLKIDIVFTDVMMPGGMNGVGLARVLRARRQDLPILLTSAHVDAANSAAADDLGVQILRKPYRLIDLSIALRKSRSLNLTVTD